jgi:hydrogenase/urease accessory protein HupE
VLKNIAGLLGIEHGIAHGIEAPLEKIMVKPPNKPVFTLNMGLLHPQRVLDL